MDKEMNEFIPRAKEILKYYEQHELEEQIAHALYLAHKRGYADCANLIKLKMMELGA